MPRYDWSRLRDDIPLDQLLEEDDVPARVIRSGGKFDCPTCGSGKKHASYHRDGNRIKCWKLGGSLSAVDYWIATRGVDKEDAARELSARFGIPVGDDHTPAAPAPPPTPPSEPTQRARATWANLRKHQATDATLAWLTEERGFPRAFVEGLARRDLLATHTRRAYHRREDPVESQEHGEAVSFPLWRLTEPGDRDTFGKADSPSALWHRFLAPREVTDDKGRTSIDKDRVQGSSRGALFTTYSLAELKHANRIYVCEGILKGLAVDVAMRGVDLLTGMTPVAEGEGGDDDPDAPPGAISGSTAIGAKRVSKQAKRRRAIARARGHKFGVWIAFSGASTATRLAEVLRVLYATREHPPCVRLALDNDDAGDRTARKLYRQLTADGWDVLIVRPAIPDYKDWDELLQAEGGDAVRAGLENEDAALVLREGAKPIAPAEWMHWQGWRLMARYEKDTKEGPKTVTQCIADFTIRGAIRYQLYDFFGELAGRDLREVIVCSREETNGRYGLDNQFFRPETYNNTDAWKVLGQVHNAALMRHYLSDAKDAILDTRKVIPIIGLMRQPGQTKEAYTLVGGDLRTALNNAYTNPVKSLYDDKAVWTASTWAGPADRGLGAQRGRQLLQALGGMFRRPIGPLALYWAVGTLCKAALSAYPHFQLVAETRAGKSTLIDILARGAGIPRTARKNWSTPVRRLRAIGNHTLPVVLDEASRLARWDRDEVVNLLGECFNPGQMLPYGQNSYPVYQCGSVLLAGQDILSDSGLETKQCLVYFERSERVDGGLPDIARLPRWPWRAWGEFLVEHLRRGHLAGRIAELEVVLREVLAGAPDRLGTCWATVLATRELTREFLGLTDDDEDAREFDALLGLASDQATMARETALESVEILRAYASIVSTEPGQHQVLVVETPGGDATLDGAWIVASAVMRTLQQRGLHFAITTARRFTQALKADGLLGARCEADEGDAWVGGYIDEGTGQAKRKTVRFRARGIRTEQKAYLIPARICERYGLDFPQPVTRDDPGGADPGGLDPPDPTAPPSFLGGPS